MQILPAAEEKVAVNSMRGHSEKVGINVEGFFLQGFCGEHACTY